MYYRLVNTTHSAAVPPPQRLIVHNRHGRVVRVTGNRILHHTQRIATALAVLIVMAFGVCVCSGSFGKYDLRMIVCKFTAGRGGGSMRDLARNEREGERGCARERRGMKHEIYATEL